MLCGPCNDLVWTRAMPAPAAPPPDELATATTMGLVVNNLSTLLYMTNYTAVIPPVEELCVRVGVSTAMAGCG